MKLITQLYTDRERYLAAEVHSSGADIAVRVQMPTELVVNPA